MSTAVNQINDEEEFTASELELSVYLGNLTTFERWKLLQGTEAVIEYIDHDSIEEACLIRNLTKYEFLDLVDYALQTLKLPVVCSTVAIPSNIDPRYIIENEVGHWSATDEVATVQSLLPFGDMWSSVSLRLYHVLREVIDNDAKHSPVIDATTFIGNVSSFINDSDVSALLHGNGIQTLNSLLALSKEELECLPGLRSHLHYIVFQLETCGFTLSAERIPTITVRSAVTAERTDDSDQSYSLVELVRGIQTPAGVMTSKEKFMSSLLYLLESNQEFGLARAILNFKFK